ncbi:MAG TPA: hypothetical protein O0X19_04010 [Methanocorpusculum sp.]|nr:hypothetical protein [Methanocorpusculum sp.]
MTRAELEKKIKRDAKAYDKAVATYNALTKKERQTGNIKQSGKKLKATSTKAGKAALKRIMTAYNAVAKKGQILRKDIAEYSRRYE